MLYGEKSRQELNEYAEKLFGAKRTKKAKREIYEKLEAQFGMRTTTADNMINFKRDISEFSTFEVFCVVYIIEPDSLSRFFTQKEIEELSKAKFEETEISFPIVFNAIQVNDDQWISTIDVKRLMEMKAAKLINYDENQQRAMRRVRNGDTEIFKPYVNKASVEAIKEAMKAGEYIPDPITFNMGDEADFQYDPDNFQLTVYSIPQGMFNLTDGYHRYLAMSAIYDFDQSFELTMELRITAFSTLKAQKFIFQADQKTKMRKIVSNSYNPSAIPNVICTRLNDSPLYSVQGMIGRNDAKINAAILGELIKTFWQTNKVAKENKNKFVSATVKEIGEKFNSLFEQNDKYFNIKYPSELLYIIMYLFSSDVPREKYSETVDYILSKLTKDDKTVLSVLGAGKVRRKGITILNNIIGGM